MISNPETWGARAIAKGAVADAWLDQGLLVGVLLKPGPGLVVPPAVLAAALKDETHPILLHVARAGLAVPITDLELGPQGITGTLSFGRTPFKCVLPWSAVIQLIALANGPDGEPEAAAIFLPVEDNEPGPEPEPEPEPEPNKPGPGLRLVP